jgi:hypothetical protein
MISVFHTHCPAVARQRRDELGECPIECAFGKESVVDDLSMDHHGALSGLQPVALHAYLDHFGARDGGPGRKPAAFVVTGAADADATFAIATLAGLLPHPSRDEDTRDLTGLANLIGRLDTAPIGVDLTDEKPWGSLYLAWRTLAGGLPDRAESFTFGARLWGQLLSPHVPPTAYEGFIEVEHARRQAAKRVSILAKIGPVSVISSGLWGFDVWFGRRPKAGAVDAVSGWSRPIIVAYAGRPKQITLACPSLAVAEALFGPGGLLNVYPLLGPGWGGREGVGGSPRGKAMEEEDAKRAAGIIVDCVLNDS